MADVLPLNYSRSLLSINAKQKTDCRDSIRFSGTGTSPTLVESSWTGTSFMENGGRTSLCGKKARAGLNCGRCSGTDTVKRSKTRKKSCRIPARMTLAERLHLLTVRLFDPGLFSGERSSHAQYFAMSKSDMKMSAVNLSCFAPHFISSFGP